MRSKVRHARGPFFVGHRCHDHRAPTITRNELLQPRLAVDARRLVRVLLALLAEPMRLARARRAVENEVHRPELFFHTRASACGAGPVRPRLTTHWLVRPP